MAEGRAGIPPATARNQALVLQELDHWIALAAWPRKADVQQSVILAGAEPLLTVKKKNRPHFFGFAVRGPTKKFRGPTSVVGPLQKFFSVVGGPTSVVGGPTPVVGGPTSVVGGPRSVVGGPTAKHGNHF